MQLTWSVWGCGVSVDEYTMNYHSAVVVSMLLDAYAAVLRSTWICTAWN